MYFNVRKRMENASFSEQPLLSCSNANDIMTVKNGKLANPVALLTYDEAALAGVQWDSSNTSSYLVNGKYYWLLSPSYFNTKYALVGIVNNNQLSSSNYSAGVRPSLSLKNGTMVRSGTGTASDPYILSTESTS